MQTGIHPKWNHTAKVVCACGNTFETGSAQDEIRVDICSACHPFYTGSMKFVDTQGRVDRFMKMRAAAQGTQKKNKAAKQNEQKQPNLSLKEMLAQEKSKIVAAQEAQK